MRVHTAPDRTTSAEPHPWAAYVEQDDGALAHVLRGYATEAEAFAAGLRALSLVAHQQREH